MYGSNFLRCLLLLVVCTTGGIQAQGLTVSIETDPPEPYPAARWIRFSCHVSGNASAVIFNWFYICSSQNPPMVVVTYENRTNVNQSDVRLRSTPSVCLDTMMCNASDLSGNSGSATWRIGRVTGAGFWGTSNFLYNMSAFQASTDGDIGTIYCHSSSTNSNVGQWISPQGEDITADHFDPFSIQFNSGSGYHSYNTFKLLDRSAQPFSSSYDGVYSCIVPDDHGIIQTLHIGIYSDQYSNILSFILDELGRSSESPITLNCPTTGLPPTAVFWQRNGEDLTNTGTYEITMVLRDRQNTTFDNFLRINQTPQEAQAIYSCEVANALDGPVQNLTTGAEITRVNRFIPMYTVGVSDYITCTLRGVSSSGYRWIDENGDTIVSDRRIIFSTNDSIHHKTYICYGFSFTTFTFRFLHIKFVINVHPGALEVATSGDSAPVLGQSYSMNCIGHKTASGLINVPSPQWLTLEGNSLSSDAQLQGPRGVGLSSSEIVATFPILRTSHAGNYTCRASLSSPALTTPIIKTTFFELIVQIPRSPSVMVAVLSTDPHLVRGTLSLQCEATVSHHVNTPVFVAFTWTRNNLPLLSSSDPRVNISKTTVISSLTYRSSLSISDLSIEVDSNMNYTCQTVVRSEPVSPYILSSESVTSNAYFLTVSPIGVSVSVVPAQITVIDVPPYNNFTLMCTATSASDTAATKVFTWSKQALGSTSSTELIHNGGSVVIITSGNVSTLMTSETQSGGYVYTCSGRIGDGEASTDTSTVNVRGPSVPDAPTNLHSTVNSFSTATISWTVSRVAYTPETYTVVYGTNRLSLNQRSTTVTGVSGTTSYSVELAQLQHGTHYYFQVQSTNTVGSTHSAVAPFEVQNASVVISITKSGNSQLAGSTFTLTCSAVELVDHSGDTVVTWKDPRGQSIQSGGDFTTTRRNMNQRVDYSLQFNPLRVLHSGQYTCEVAIPTVGYNDSRNISVQVTPGTLSVNIERNGTSQVGTSLQLGCQVGNTLTPPIGAVVYEWTSTCSGGCFVLRQPRGATVGTQYLKAVDSGTHTCTVTDSVGNRGSASVSIATRGVTLYHSINGLLPNNSVVMASNGFLPGSFFCVSGRRQAGIGRWISPSGDDYTLPGIHPYDVTVGGQNNSGVVEVSVSGSNGRFPAGQWNGVYSCVIPDESGAEQILHLGIYIVFGSSLPQPLVQSLTASSLGVYPQFTLNCSSSGSAASEVSWTIDNQPLDLSRQVYNVVQLLRDGTTSTYDNLLVVSISSVDEYSGQYSCSVRNSFGSTSEEATFTGIAVSEHGAFPLGSEVSITCSSDFGVTDINWVLDGQVVSTTVGSVGELSIREVTENHHNRIYTCRATAPFGVQTHTITLQVEVGPDDALSVAITSSPASLQEGERFTLTCTANKSLHLQSTPSVNWYDGMGNRIVTDEEIRVGHTVESGDGMVMKTLTFDSLDRSHTMEYRCNATITFRPPPYVISKVAIWNLVVQVNDTGTVSPTVYSTTTAMSDGGVSVEGAEQQLDQFIYIGSGVGGGVGVVVLFIIVILIIACCRRCKKKKQRYSMRMQLAASGIPCYNDNFSMAKGATNIPYGMAMAQGAFVAGPGTAESMMPHTKFHNDPELPPRKDLYMTPQSTLTPPNDYEYSDSYIKMRPVAPVYLSGSPPPHYEASSSLKMAVDDEFYDEIPGEYLQTSTFSSKEEKGCDNGLKLQHADEEEWNDLKKSENV